MSIVKQWMLHLEADVMRGQRCYTRPDRSMDIGLTRKDENSMALNLPEALHARRPTMADAQIVVDLIRFCQLREWKGSEITVEDTLTLWGEPEMDLEQDAWLIFAPDNQLVAYLHLLRRDSLRMNINKRVHPDYDTLELQHALIMCAEERARQLIPQLRPDARITLNTTCSTLATPVASEAAKQAGFDYIRSSFRMEIAMETPPPKPIWPEGIVLRPFTLEMARAVHAADDEAFSDHWGYTSTPFETFEHIFIKSPKFDPTLWFLPFAGEEIAGTALCEHREEIGFVNSLSVRRPWRRQGLGLALLHHTFGEFYQRDVRKVALYVDAQSLTGATRLYERAGMKVVRQFDQYEKELRAGIELSTQEIEA